MPIAKIQAPDGRIITLEVPQGATQDQIIAHLQQNPPEVPDLNTRPQLQMEEPSLANKLAGGLENVSSFISGAAAEPVAGVAGLLASATPFADEGAGARTVENVREALTTQPKTESGVQQQQAVGETLAPVAEKLSQVERFLGEKTLETTDSPFLASLAHTLPTAALEALGLKGGKAFKRLDGTPTKRQVRTAIVESAPEVKQLKSVARGIYDEIDSSGVRIKKESVNKLVDSIEKITKRKGLDARTTKQAAGALDVLKGSKGIDQTLTELDTLRNVANNVAKSVDKVESSLGNTMISKIDEFLDNAKPIDFIGGKGTSTAKKFKAARGLWGRAARADVIEEAITKGSSRASGAEAGIRNELNRILNSKKQSKFFPKPELDAMRKVVDGNFAQNFTKMIGKLGMSVDRAPNVFQSIFAGGGLGAVVGGGAGAVAVPLIGTVSKQIAKTLTTGKARFLNKMSRAGNNADKITKAYLTTVPKAKRSVKDLADLLSDPELDLSVLEDVANRTIQDALDLAKGQRQLRLANAAALGATAQQLGDDNGE